MLSNSISLLFLRQLFVLASHSVVQIECQWCHLLSRDHQWSRYVQYVAAVIINHPIQVRIWQVWHGDHQNDLMNMFSRTESCRSIWEDWEEQEVQRVPSITENGEQKTGQQCSHQSDIVTEWFVGKNLSIGICNSQCNTLGQNEIELQTK